VKKIFPFIILFLLFNSSVYSQLKGITSYDNAYRYMTAGEFEKAIGYYNEYLKSYPSDSKAYDERGRCYENLRQYENALKDYSSAISLSPFYGTYYNDRGYAYLKSGMPENSVSDFTSSINYNPNSSDGYEGRVQAYLDLGKNDLALTDINKAMLLAPDNPMYLVTRAVIYSNLEDTSKFYSDIENILNYYPGSFFASYKSQIVSLLLDNFYSNIQKLNSQIEDNPGDRVLYFKRGFNYYLLKKFDAAISDFEKCVSISGSNDRHSILSNLFIENSKSFKE
jgi:tetratricopeptide (TPR) repeat protein